MNRPTGKQPGAETMPRVYPLPAPDDDKRFCLGFFLDVEEVLENHGYPALAREDHVELRLALYRFLYTVPRGR